MGTTTDDRITHPREDKQNTRHTHLSDPTLFPVWMPLSTRRTSLGREETNIVETLQASCKASHTPKTKVQPVEQVRVNFSLRAGKENIQCASTLWHHSRWSYSPPAQQMPSFICQALDEQERRKTAKCGDWSRRRCLLGSRVYSLTFSRVYYIDEFRTNDRDIPFLTYRAASIENLGNFDGSAEKSRES